MINIFIALMFAIFSFQIFFSCSRATSINRTLVNLPIELIKNAVVISEYGDNKTIYFNQEVLISNLDSYFETNLRKYTSSYTTNYLFLEPNGLSVCLEDKCQAVKVEVNAHIVFSFSYSKSMIYKIGESYG